MSISSHAHLTDIGREQPACARLEPEAKWDGKTFIGIGEQTAGHLSQSLERAAFSKGALGSGHSREVIAAGTENRI
jgi:hypothetical protein